MILAVKVFIPISSHVRKLKMTDSAENADPKTVRNLFQIVLPFINKNFIAAPLNDFNLLATIIIDQIRWFFRRKRKNIEIYIRCEDSIGNPPEKKLLRSTIELIYKNTAEDSSK